MKKTIIAITIILALAFLGAGAYFFVKDRPDVKKQDTVVVTTPTDNEPAVTKDTSKTVIGKSVEKRDIVAYHFGLGTTTEILFIGGIHGGYEWNTSLVAYELMDYLKQNPAVVPTNLKVTVIPVLNPDGLYKTVGTTTRFVASDVKAPEAIQVAGRFNANNVDLNRNFDCDWQATGKWQNKSVSGGTQAFSEPESQAIKNYVEGNKPTAVVVWYSSAGGVFASSCHNGVSAETNTLTKKYADASTYPAYQSFNFYEITGDMVNWLAKNNIPAISVLLTNHTSTEWDKNKAGIEALFKYYAR